MRQASSIVICPLRTAATTAALRRTTHLFVSGGGRRSMSGVLARDSPGHVSSPGRGDADDPTSQGRDVLVIDLAGRVAACPLVPGSTCQFLRAVHSRSFHGYFTISKVFVILFLFVKGPRTGLCHSGH
jgi:hypothetical protein